MTAAALAPSRPTVRLLNALHKVRRSGDGWQALCPAHDDRAPSLSIHVGNDGRVLLYCHAGCELAAVLGALGLEPGALFEDDLPVRAHRNGPTSTPVLYQVRDDKGSVVAIHERTEVGGGGKRYRWLRPDGSPGLNGTKSVALPLFGVEHVAGWDPASPVILVEGERATIALRDAGYQGLGTVTGASTVPEPVVLEVLRGREVVLWPDADDPGRKHMDAIAERLAGIAALVRVVRWPDAPPHADAADVDPIGMAELVDAAQPWQPPGSLRYYTPAELSGLTLPAPDWLIPGFIARQLITEIDGKVKAAGKTTLMLEIVRAILDAVPFLGQPTQASRVLYVSEQQRQPFMDAMRRAGLDSRGDELLILFREDLRGRIWPEVVAATQTRAKTDDRGLVVIDTIGKLAGIVNENDAGEWSAAMSPLQDLAASGCAVLIGRHDRKSGGEVGESGRGSSQASGDVDIILALRRPEGNQPSTRRVLESLSRYPDTPEKVVIELTDDGYTLLGSEEAVATGEAREMLLLALGREYRQDESPTQKELVELGASRSPKIGRWAIQEALAALIAEDVVATSGTPRSRKDPLRYRLRGLAGTPSIGSSGNTPGDESETDLLAQADAPPGLTSERFDQLLIDLGGTEVDADGRPVH